MACKASDGGGWVWAAGLSGCRPKVPAVGDDGMTGKPDSRLGHTTGHPGLHLPMALAALLQPGYCIDCR